MTTYLAVDIGASGGRHILGWLEQGRIRLKEMYRFENIQFEAEGHQCWDIQGLWHHILAGLKACKAMGQPPSFVGIDTWGVDFVLLDEQGALASQAVSYRDARTQGRQQLIADILTFPELYAKTGIQYQSFNTIYQLLALREEQPNALRDAAHFVMMPAYFNFLLTGNILNEYTNCTTTALINAHTRTWDDELLTRLSLPAHLFGQCHMPGTVVGGFAKDVRKAVGFDAAVLLPATHDTGSAFLAVPARDAFSVYLSSGTWSLLGVELTAPIITEQSRAHGFSNEGGYQYCCRFLKNIMGLWMIQSIRRELNGVAYVSGKELREKQEKQWSYPELIAEAQACTTFSSLVDVNDDRFLSPDSMIEQVKCACADSGQPVPESVGELMQCVYLSLAACYQQAITELESITGRHYTSINIVGGGCQDRYLNQLTAAATGLPVWAGPVEGSALGNIIAQMLADKAFDSPEQAREAVRKSFDIKGYYP